MFSFGAEDENAPQREDFPMGRSGAKKFSDAMKLYNAAKSASVNNLNVEPQLDLNASDLPVIPPSDEVASTHKLQRQVVMQKLMHWQRHMQK